MECSPERNPKTWSCEPPGTWLVLVGFHLPLMILSESRCSSSDKISPGLYHCLADRKPKNHHEGAAVLQVPALLFADLKQVGV